jgi:hypothetical protein
VPTRAALLQEDSASRDKRRSNRNAEQNAQ